MRSRQDGLRPYCEIHSRKECDLNQKSSVEDVFGDRRRRATLYKRRKWYFCLDCSDGKNNVTQWSRDERSFLNGMIALDNSGIRGVTTNHRCCVAGHIRLQCNGVVRLALSRALGCHAAVHHLAACHLRGHRARLQHKCHAGTADDKQRHKQRTCELDMFCESQHFSTMLDYSTSVPPRWFRI